MPSITDDITVDKAEEIAKTTGLGFTKTPDGKIQLITPTENLQTLKEKKIKDLSTKSE